MRHCKHCNKELTAGQRLFCSRRCAGFRQRSMSRTCGKCGAEMYQQKSGRWRCSPCANAYNRKSYEAAPDKIRKRKRESMAKQRSTPEGHERALNASRRSWANGRSLKQKVYLRNLRENRFFVWRARNWEHGRISARQLASLWKMQRGRCTLSGRRLGRDAHLDHILPKSLGGVGDIANLRWLDPLVNLARRNLSDDEFITLCAEIYQHSLPQPKWIGSRILEVAGK